MCNLKKIEEKTKKIEPIFGAKIVAQVEYKGKIVSQERNQKKTHPYQSKLTQGKKNFLHAEVATIIKAKKNISTFKDVILTVCRIGKDGKIKPSKPCIHCMQAIKEHGISKIQYFNGNEYIIENI
jgi:tRNA(Arg) A34 adenosine deaminase TadA